MKEKLYVDINGNRLWRETLEYGKTTKVVPGQYGNVHLTEKHTAEAELVSESFFFDVLYTICSTVRVYRNEKNEYAVMVIQQDSMGYAEASYVSLHGTFCFTEVYAYPEQGGDLRTARLVMKTTEGSWVSYTLFQAPFTPSGVVLYHMNEPEGSAYKEMNQVCDLAQAELRGGLRDLREEGCIDIHLNPWQKE